MAKKQYRVRNWSEYNENLVQRGSVTFWIDEKIIQRWYAKVKKAVKSLLQWAKLPLEAPDYTTLCKRQKKSLAVKLLRRKSGIKEALHVVIDSTGLKVFGEGE